MIEVVKEWIGSLSAVQAALVFEGIAVAWVMLGLYCMAWVTSKMKDD